MYLGAAASPDVRQRVASGGTAASAAVQVFFFIRPLSDMDSKNIKGLVIEISSYLRKNRDSLPDEAVRLLEEARDELQRIRSEPPDDEEDLKAKLSRVALHLLRFFAKPETMEQIERITDELGELC